VGAHSSKKNGLKTGKRKYAVDRKRGGVIEKKLEGEPPRQGAGEKNHYDTPKYKPAKYIRCRVFELEGGAEPNRNGKGRHGEIG